MNSTRNLWVALIVVAIIATGGLFWGQNTITEKVVERIVGVAAGPDHFIRENFYNGYIAGGVFATSSAGTATYSAASFANATLVSHTATAALTATLPASTTMSFMSKVGDTKTIFIAPLTTNITLVAGTGLNIHNATSSTMYKGGLTRLDFVRAADSDIEVMVTEATD